MDERYCKAEKACIEKVVSEVKRGYGVPENDMERGLWERVEVIIRASAKVAFEDGYESGYRNGVDDARDVD